MLTLFFNTTEKTMRLEDSNNENTLFEFENVITVKPLDGYYEIMQREGDSTLPILRVPIGSTIMRIIK